MRRDEKHVSDEERRRNRIIRVLIGVLVCIFVIIVIIMIPKGNKKEKVKNLESTVSKDSMIDSNTTNKKDGDDYDRDPKKVSIIVEREGLSEDGAVITIVDANKEPYSWTPIYKLQEQIDGEWEDMVLENPENAFFPETNIENPTGRMTQSLVWVNKYGKLKSGVNYRIVKETDGKEFYAEFQID